MRKTIPSLLPRRVKIKAEKKQRALVVGTIQKISAQVDNREATKTLEAIRVIGVTPRGTLTNRNGVNSRVRGMDAHAATSEMNMKTRIKRAALPKSSVRKINVLEQLMKASETVKAAALTTRVAISAKDAPLVTATAIFVRDARNGLDAMLSTGAHSEDSPSFAVHSKNLPY